jgi:hypothetical protein
MELPGPMRARITELANEYNRGHLLPLADHHPFLKDAARADPSSVTTVLEVLIKKFNDGRIPVGYEAGWWQCFGRSPRLRSNLGVRSA